MTVRNRAPASRGRLSSATRSPRPRFCRRPFASALLPLLCLAFQPCEHRGLVSFLVRNDGTGVRERRAGVFIVSSPTSCPRRRRRRLRLTPEVEPEVLAAATFATRYEMDAKTGGVIVELVDEATDEWVVRVTPERRTCVRREGARPRGGRWRSAKRWSSAKNSLPAKLLPCPRNGVSSRRFDRRRTSG